MINLLRISYLLGLFVVYFSLHYPGGGALWTDQPFGQLIGYALGAVFGASRIFVFYGWVIVVPVLVFGFRFRKFFYLFAVGLLGYILFFGPYYSRLSNLSDYSGDTRLQLGIAVSAVISAAIAFGVVKMRSAH
tara:strand:- start:35 stop:433 length:399 start_codon:yes stop_codon:yes gene_type:complete